MSTELANEVRAVLRANPGKEINPEMLWKVYEKIYRNYPEWLAAIKSYFPHVK